MSRPHVNKYFVLFVLIILLCTVSTTLFISWKSTHVGNLEEFNKWLNDADHKCIVTKEISGIKVSVKYQPPQYIAFKDKSTGMPAGKGQTYDSILLKQKKMLTFLMTLSPDKDVPELKRAGPIMYEGVSDYSEYASRVLSTNFFMGQYIRLYVDGVQYAPALCLVENLYELADQRDFMVVFVAEGKTDINQGHEYVFVYNDPYFNMGKMQFVFSSKDFEAAKNVTIMN